MWSRLFVPVMSHAAIQHLPSISKELLNCINTIFIVFRESLVNKDLLALVVTVDLLDLWDPLDFLDLLESLVER